MSILILFSGQFPGHSAGAKRIGYYQKGLIAAGMPADILPIANLAIGRLSHYLNLVFQPFKAAKSLYKVRKKYTVVLIYGFGWGTYLLLALVAGLSGSKIYLEVNEKPGSVYGSRITEIGWVKFFSTKLTEFSYRFFDGFVVISEALGIYIKPHLNRNARLIIVPIIVDTDREGLGTVAPVAHPYLLHAGALSDRKDGIGEVMDAFAIACKNSISPLHIYFTSKVAPTDLWQKIQQVINDNDLKDKVHFLGDITEENLLAYQRYCSMLIINKHVNEQNLHNFPTKLGEYLVLERPVITTAIGEMGKYLKDGDNAFIVPLHNIQAMAEKITYVLNNPEESAIVGRRGKETASLHFDYLVQGKRLINFFKENQVK